MGAAPVGATDGPSIEEVNTEDEDEWPKEAEKALRAVCNKFSTTLHKFVKAKKRHEKFLGLIE
eukprot:1140104-Karenia_brevis.AAC.1